MSRQTSTQPEKLSLSAMAFACRNAADSALSRKDMRPSERDLMYKHMTITANALDVFARHEAETRAFYLSLLAKEAEANANK